MKFTPPPPDEFAFFINTYFSRCLDRCPKLRCIAGKWNYEDLIPGLSDFDSRLLFSADMTLADWLATSVQVGEIHTELAWEHPGWARILEHLPGLNLTVEEIIDPWLYYPEFPQWTFYDGSRNVIGTIEEHLSAQSWSSADEAFHLQKFAYYCGPYQRGIDPPINLGAWESKYPLHSRFMHYFAPPVQSAVSIMLKRPMRGKIEALRTAAEIFPDPQVIDMVLDAVERHYEIPEMYKEPRLTAVERQLEQYLWQVWERVRPVLTTAGRGQKEDSSTLQSAVAALPVDPVRRFFEHARFSRAMRGRLLFYSHPPPSFDSNYLISHEARRTVQSFYDRALADFARAYWGELLQPPEVLARLRGNILAPETCDGVVKFVEVARAQMQPLQQHAAALAGLFDDVLIMLETLYHALRRSRQEGSEYPSARSMSSTGASSSRAKW